MKHTMIADGRRSGSYLYQTDELESKMRFPTRYHTLAYGCSDESDTTQKAWFGMTKKDILSAFAQTNELLSPNEVRIRLHLTLDGRSLYSYLLRLAKQGLLRRVGTRRGHLTYSLTDRGRARLEYLRHQQK